METNQNISSRKIIPPKCKYILFKSKIIMNIRLEIESQLDAFNRYKIIHLMPEDYLTFDVSSNRGTYCLKRINLLKIKLPSNFHSLVYLKYMKKVTRVDFSNIELSRMFTRLSIRPFKNLSRTLKKIHLDLTRFNSLSGSECLSLQQTLCNNLKYLPKLSSLSVVFSDLDKTIREKFLSFLRKQQNLEELSLNTNSFHIRDSDIQIIFEEISSITKINTLNLNLGRIEGEKSIDFKCLQNISMLQNMELAIVELNEISWLSLNNLLAYNKLLKNMSLKYFSNEDSNGFDKIIATLFDIGLEELYIQSYKILRFPCDIKNQSLRKFGIKMSNAALFPENFSLIPYNFDKKFFQTLDLTINNMPIDYFQLVEFFNFAGAIQTLKKLSLDLTNCWMNKKFLSNIIVALSSTKSLEYLKLSFKNLSINDEQLEQISSFIKGNIGLYFVNLNISSNTFTIAGIQNLLKSLSEINCLRVLSLDVSSCSNLTKQIKLNLRNLIIYKYNIVHTYALTLRV